MSSLSINHICKVKGLPRNYCDSPPRNTNSNHKRVAAMIREARLSPPLTLPTINMACASTKQGLPEQSKNSPMKQRAKPKFFCMLSYIPWVRLWISLVTAAWRFTIWLSIMILVIEIERPRASEKFSCAWDHKKLMAENSLILGKSSAVLNRNTWSSVFQNFTVARRNS